MQTDGPPTEHDTLPPGSLHPDEDTGKELHKLDDLLKGLPGLADQVFHLTNALPSLRRDFEKFHTLADSIGKIELLVQQAVNVGIAAASENEKTTYEQGQQSARLDRLEHQMAALHAKLDTLTCRGNGVCPADAVQ